MSNKLNEIEASDNLILLNKIMEIIEFKEIDVNHEQRLCELEIMKEDDE
jgi:hypothetical protein